MKKINILILSSILLAGCAKKTHILTQSSISARSKFLKDSTVQKKNEIVDMSTTVIVKDIDTSFTIRGKTLTAYFNTSVSPGNDSVTDTSFDNDDLSIRLQTNKKTGITKATATLKAKIVPVKIHEKTIVQNDIHSTTNENSVQKVRAENKIDSTKKQIADQTEPSVMGKTLRTIFIWLLAICAVIAAVIYLVKKFSIIGWISGWIKQIG